MKSKLLKVFVLVLMVLFSRASEPWQNSEKQKVKISSSKFTGTWRGSEKCINAGAPVAILTITPNGESELALSGIYSIQGKVKAIIRDNSIIIPRQEVKDPNFRNLQIEGELSLSDKTGAISGTIKVVNNDAKDECSVEYHK